MIEHVKNYIRAVTDNSEPIRRFDICTECNDFNPENARCFSCGCYLQVKVILPFAKCPQGKW
jgi:hypothetical protein